MHDDVTKPPEEKYEGEVDKPGDGIRHHWQAFCAFEQNSQIRVVFKGLLDCWKMPRI